MKRRVLQEAVAENLDTIRGLPPRAARPAQRALRLWGRRAPLLLVPMLLAGSTYMMTNAAAPPHAAPVGATQAMVQRPMFLAAETTPVVERMTATAFPLAVKRVVLDAGHGGSDPGATAEQLLEKEITLDIGRRLRQKLERDGFEVVVTREADRTVALRDRAKLANDSRSDIFVSIHVNALLAHTNARGIETYYLGATSDPKLTQLAAAENRVSGYSIADMRALLDGVYAGARRDESHALAGAVQHQLFTTLRKADPGLENWGVKRAPFLVLVATDMPAVLAEVGCISNEKEAAMLRRPEYRQQIADALFAGIRGYAKKGSENHG
jgi:N-acetylmuramoyl-L-alanine amidase